MAATSRGGKASRRRKAVTNIAQQKKGIFIHAMPLVRRLMMVAMKLTEPRREAEMLNTIAISHHMWPWFQMLVTPMLVVEARGEYIVQPVCTGPVPTKKLYIIRMPLMKKNQ